MGAHELDAAVAAALVWAYPDEAKHGYLQGK